MVHASRSGHSLLRGKQLSTMLGISLRIVHVKLQRLTRLCAVIARFFPTFKRVAAFGAGMSGGTVDRKRNRERSSGLERILKGREVTMNGGGNQMKWGILAALGAAV